jgi:hypothetical protein
MPYHTRKVKCPAICPPTLPINFLVGNTAAQEGVVRVINGTESQRLFRNGIPNSCSITKTCPGPFTVTVPFSVLEFDNPGRKKACVTITITNLSAQGTLFSHAHLKRYDPNNVCKNYLGDAGLSNTVTSYKINLPDGAKRFAIVVEGVSPPSQTVPSIFGLLTISGLACQSASAEAETKGAESSTPATIIPGLGNDLKPIATPTQVIKAQCKPQRRSRK